MDAKMSSDEYKTGYDPRVIRSPEGYNVAHFRGVVDDEMIAQAVVVILNETKRMIDRIVDADDGSE